MNIKSAIIPLIIGLITFFTVSLTNQRKIGYVDLTKVFHEFEMKKELQVSYDQEMSERRKMLDSLNFVLGNLRSRWESDSKDEGLYEVMMNQWQMNEQLQNKIEEDMQMITEEFDIKIQKQLKQYLEDFGKGKNLDLLFGLNDSGSILYGNESDDLTDEAVLYINNKYHDK